MFENWKNIIVIVGVNTLDIGVATGGCQDRSGDSDMVDTGHDLSLVVMVWQVMDQLDRWDACFH